MKKLLLILPLSIWGISMVFAQSLLDQVGKDEEETEYVKYSFKTNRVINLHSLESTAKGVMDFKISHRFGVVDDHFYDLFGLDQATQRFGFDFGLTDDLSVGVNRNSVRKAYDAFAKYRILRQSTGKRKMPVTLAVLVSSAIETQKWSDPTRDNHFSSRLFYTSQIIVGRKFSDLFSLELVPTYVHRNLVATNAEKNDVFALGVGGRIRLNRRVTFNGEYVFVPKGQLATGMSNALSLGFDIETGGHGFQLHFTNSTSMSEYSVVTQTEKPWGKEAVRLGFNVSRVFTLYDDKKRK